MQKDLTPRPHCSCSGNVGPLLFILSTSNYTESAFMQYEGQGPFCVYVGYASRDSLGILTTNKLQRPSHKLSSSHFKQVNLTQEKKGTGEHWEYLKMNKQVASLDSRHSNIYPDTAEIFHLLYWCFCSLQGLIHGHVLHFFPFFLPHLHVNSLCISGLCGFLHQPAVRLRRVPGRGP